MTSERRNLCEYLNDVVMRINIVVISRLCRVSLRNSPISLLHSETNAGVVSQSSIYINKSDELSFFATLIRWLECYSNISDGNSSIFNERRYILKEIVHCRETKANIIQSSSGQLQPYPRTCSNPTTKQVQSNTRYE